MADDSPPSLSEGEQEEEGVSPPSISDNDEELDSSLQLEQQQERTQQQQQQRTQQQQQQQQQGVVFDSRCVTASDGLTFFFQQYLLFIFKYNKAMLVH